MASRITVRLPDSLRRTLEETARRTHRKASAIVRTALREYLRIESAASARRLVGSLASGIPDLAERHRGYVLESLRRGR